AHKTGHVPRLEVPRFALPPHCLLLAPRIGPAHRSEECARTAATEALHPAAGAGRAAGDPAPRADRPRPRSAYGAGRRDRPTRRDPAAPTPPRASRRAAPPRARAHGPLP